VDVLTGVERLYEGVQQVLLKGIVVLIVCAMEVRRRMATEMVMSGCGISMVTEWVRW
jgi:hypothetical protein